jgi:hypothetical protein
VRPLPPTWPRDAREQGQGQHQQSSTLLGARAAVSWLAHNCRHIVTFVNQARNLHHGDDRVPANIWLFVAADMGCGPAELDTFVCNFPRRAARVLRELKQSTRRPHVLCHTTGCPRPSRTCSRHARHAARGL